MVAVQDPNVVALAVKEGVSATGVEEPEDPSNLEAATPDFVEETDRDRAEVVASETVEAFVVTAWKALSPAVTYVSQSGIWRLCSRLPKIFTSRTRECRAGELKSSRNENIANQFHCINYMYLYTCEWGCFIQPIINALSNLLHWVIVSWKYILCCCVKVLWSSISKKLQLSLISSCKLVYLVVK